jgi:hypothetical protein
MGYYAISWDFIGLFNGILWDFMRIYLQRISMRVGLIILQGRLFDPLLCSYMNNNWFAP